MKKNAMLWETAEDNRVRCFLCSHCCLIQPGKFGVCGVRQNINGEMFTYAYGEVIARHVDPIEKKPLYHFLPGTRSYSVATVGCNFKCGFCQNWRISQSSFKDGSAQTGRLLTPEKAVEEARESRCRSIAYTYTEPTIFFEYAYDTARLAAEAGLSNIFVTNGYMTEEALNTIAPYLHATNVDLKSFREEFYHDICKAHIAPVLETIRRMKEMGIWVEVTTLVVPGRNDSGEELRQIAQFIAGVSPDIPWHVTRFHPGYQFTDFSPTPQISLRKAQDIGRESGLRHVYLGNIVGGSNTSCHRCGELLVQRSSFFLEVVSLEDGSCPSCGARIEGVWCQSGDTR